MQNMAKWCTAERTTGANRKVQGAGTKARACESAAPWTAKRMMGCEKTASNPPKAIGALVWLKEVVPSNEIAVATTMKKTAYLRVQGKQCKRMGTQ